MDVFLLPAAPRNARGGEYAEAFRTSSKNIRRVPRLLPAIAFTRSVPLALARRGPGNAPDLTTEVSRWAARP
nr:MAG TPA: hypothetical protein [Caudoviricetes sp.]